jgi:endo-1,4-beta-xylanase
METINSNTRGKFDGFEYELWRQSSGDVSMTLTGGGTFKCRWDEADNILFRTGQKLGSNATHDELGDIFLDYGVDYHPDGNSYLCLYGWTVDPLLEFYVVEAWGSWRPPGADSKGIVTVDGGTYDIYETTRYDQPSILGVQTFQQFWSVRTEKKTEGTISVTEHIKIWENMGMKLGKMHEAALCVEGYKSSGIANVFKHVLKIGDTTFG